LLAQWVNRICEEICDKDDNHLDNLLTNLKHEIFKMVTNDDPVRCKRIIKFALDEQLHIPKPEVKVVVDLFQEAMGSGEYPVALHEIALLRNLGKMVGLMRKISLTYMDIQLMLPSKEIEDRFNAEHATNTETPDGLADKLTGLVGDRFHRDLFEPLFLKTILS